MPAATTTQAVKSEREERLLNALKTHIQKERQRKKEEHEAEVEEERLRREREAREKQDEMTLGETREQIQKLDQKLKELKNQKQQLFLQLKKVLNEDENRKKQQQQKDSEIFMHALPPQAAPHGQIFLPPRQAPQQILQKGAPINIGNPPIKRGRSPSPPSPQGYYKNPAYTTSSKHEDARRGDVARVLWNKPAQYPQYQNPPGTLFYQTTSAPPVQPDSRAQSIMYPSYNLNLMHPRPNCHMEMAPQPPQPQVHPKQNDKIYINIDVHMPLPHQNAAGGHNVKPGHVAMEVKPDPSQPQAPHLPEGVAYTSLMPGLPMHPTVMQMPANQQNPKPSSGANQGYPSRSSGHNQPPMPDQQSQSQQIHYPRRLF